MVNRNGYFQIVFWDCQNEITGDPNSLMEFSVTLFRSCGKLETCVFMNTSKEIKHLPEMSFREKLMQNGYMACINYIAKSRKRLSVSSNQGMR